MTPDRWPAWRPVEKYTGAAGETREMRWQADPISGGWVLFSSAPEPPPLFHAPAWRPISTAPRDGTRVDLWIVSNDGTPRRVPDARWEEAWPVDQHVQNGPTCACWVAPGFWYEGEEGRISWAAVTHWMPIPPAPDAADG